MSIRDLMTPSRSKRLPVFGVSSFERSLQDLQDEMSRLMETFYGDMVPAAWTKEDMVPAVDIIESEKGFEVRAEVPGMDADDVKISVTDGFLTIEGEKEEEKKEEGKDFLRKETSYGSFSRTLALPDTADTNKAEASFKNGMLTIQVPKKAEALQKPRTIAVKKAA